MDSVYGKQQRKLLMKMTMVAMVITIPRVSAKLHHVGGSSGWTQNVSYSEWSSQEQFYLHDWLLFQFDKHVHNVLEVNKTNYESCRDGDSMTNITRGGRDVFELKEARDYYFICSRGFCQGGMKVAISVYQAPPPPGALLASPALLTSGATSTHTMTVLLAFSMVLCALFIYKRY